MRILKRGSGNESHTVLFCIWNTFSEEEESPQNMVPNMMLCKMQKQFQSSIAYTKSIALFSYDIFLHNIMLFVGSVCCSRRSLQAWYHAASVGHVPLRPAHVWLFWSHAPLPSHTALVGRVSLRGHVALAVAHLSAFINSYIPIRPIRTVVFIHSSYCDYLCRVDVVDQISYCGYPTMCISEVGANGKFNWLWILHLTLESILYFNWKSSFSMLIL